jgi:hypothetical protein
MKYAYYHLVGNFGLFGKNMPYPGKMPGAKTQDIFERHPWSGDNINV